MAEIQFTGGYKYQLSMGTMILTKVYPREDYSNPFLALSTDGFLTIYSGYAWDGPSGPVFDTKPKMRASLFHDALYQVARHGHLTRDDVVIADKLFMDTCIEDGLAKWRAKMYYRMLRRFGGKARSVDNKRQIRYAP